MRKKRMQRKLKVGLTRFWRSWGRGILIAIAIVVPLRSSVADWNDVPTGSMRPTILEGDRVFVNKAAYSLRVPLTKWHLLRWDGPSRGDIIVCFSPDDGKRLIKRVIGVPGDTVSMRNNRLLINGSPTPISPLEQEAIRGIPAKDLAGCVFVREDLGEMSHAVVFIPSRPAQRSFSAIVVPQGKYLIMGDNRDNSADSRMFGLVAEDLIVGRGVAVVFSRDPDNHRLPRRERWFHKLQ